jgi:septal ring factor EnvC (AmiA/AmiB activator)
MTSPDNKQDKAIAILETNYNFMIQQLKEIKEGISSIQNEIKSIRNDNVKKFEDHIKESDSRYASKRVELMVDKVIWAVFISVVLALTALVIK